MHKKIFNFFRVKILTKIIRKRRRGHRLPNLKATDHFYCEGVRLPMLRDRLKEEV